MAAAQRSNTDYELRQAACTPLHSCCTHKHGATVVCIHQGLPEPPAKGVCPAGGHTLLRPPEFCCHTILGGVPTYHSNKCWVVNVCFWQRVQYHADCTVQAIGAGCNHDAFAAIGKLVIVVLILSGF